jgi:hypothetical protein
MNLRMNEHERRFRPSLIGAIGRPARLADPPRAVSFDP